MAFTDDERTFLRSARLGRVATASASGEPDVAAVGFSITHDDRVEITGMDNTKTRKYHNVLANPRASMVVDDLASIDPWQPRGLKVTGSAVIGTDGQGRPTIVVTPETVWSWGLNPSAETYFGPIEKRTVED